MKFLLDVAVETYLFNSQLVEYENGHILLAPIRCRRNCFGKKIHTKYSQVKIKMIKKVRYINLEQSLHNGGGMLV